MTLGAIIFTQIGMVMNSRKGRALYSKLNILLIGLLA